MVKGDSQFDCVVRVGVLEHSVARAESTRLHALASPAAIDRCQLRLKIPHRAGREFQPHEVAVYRSG